MISPPPKSTLFPYTTLFRSQQTKQNNPDHQTNTGQIYRQQEWHPKQSPSRGLVDINKASTWTLLWMPFLLSVDLSCVCLVVWVILFGLLRSEERRVGKECRFRWWRYH